MESLKDEQLSGAVKRSLSECVSDVDESLPKKKCVPEEKEISNDADTATDGKETSTMKENKSAEGKLPEDAHSSNGGKETLPQKGHKSNEFSEDADSASEENKMLAIKQHKSDEEKYPEDAASNCDDEDVLSDEDKVPSDDEDELQDEELSTTTDFFAKHVEYENKLKPNEYKHGSNPQPCSFPNIPDMIYVKPDCSDVDEPLANLQDISQFGLKKNLLEGLQQSSEKLSPFQIDFYNILADYRDLIFMRRTPTKGKEMQKVYMLHVLNHILKSRAKIVHHNSKLSKNPDEEYRDQGFVRPTVVILAPFRHDCFQIVKQIESLLPECVMMNKKRFTTEYGPPPQKKKMKKKPQDFEDTFKGNTDDDFKIGLRIQNKSVTLYSEFYSSDLIIASPLGLIRIAGDKKDKDVDYLSSIEILIIDRVDVLYQQNLVNLLNIVQDFNHLPKESHDCNFFRVRMYALDGNAKYFRQTVLISSVEQRFYESAIFRNFCFNYKGYLSTFTQVKTPGINKIFDTVRVCFRLFDTADPASEIDDRFEFFTKKVLPEFKEKEFVQTLIYIPSYFDFVRLRNFFRENEMSAVMVCEHSKPGKVAQARNYFFNGWRHFMLYTERAHFYNRYNIKGVQHILFYQPSTNPRFFQDVNFYFLDSNPKRKGEQKTCTIVASKNDFIPLKNIVGLSEAKKMVDSDQKIFIRYVEEQKRIL
ncbi:Digestive organ expansion factor [Araneus ventricosus]|uniref:U3 small nucleolar RNA-associated protein 25 homolog n=1 Tax=Araneus ventricosus TaxID=182803 RepID=A0A4Y2AES1_ARAVE|nr:Digestive organ expansion factor [Araneus ventricosus]